MARTIRSLAALLALTLTAIASGANGTPAGTVSMVTGRATAVGADGAVRALREDDKVFEGELISTGPSTYLNVVFRDNGRVLLRPNTRFAIDQFKYQAPAAASGGRPAAAAPADSAFFRLLKGGFRAVTGAVGKRDQADYRVRTPVATIGIRGTDYESRLCQGDCLDVDPPPTDGLYTGVNQGTITLTNDQGTVEQPKGKFTFTSLTTGGVVTLKDPPKVLTQDPMPDPADCD